MKVIAIVGSFRKGGNTDLIVDQALAGARARGAETEKIFVDDLKVAPCQGCMECRKEGICKQEDDLMTVIRKIEDADGVIFGSPIYGNYMTGQLKVLLDRMMGVINQIQYLPGQGRKTVTRLAPKKREVLIVLTAGAPDPDCAADALKLMRRMFGSFTNGGKITEIVATGLSAKGQVAMGPEELEKIARLHGAQDPAQASREAKARNEAILARAYREGENLSVLAPENDQGKAMDDSKE